MLCIVCEHLLSDMYRNAILVVKGWARSCLLSSDLLIVNSFAALCTEEIPCLDITAHLVVLKQGHCGGTASPISSKPIIGG